jgi:hypothetical protein
MNRVANNIDGFFISPFRDFLSWLCSHFVTSYHGHVAIKSRLHNKQDTDMRTFIFLEVHLYRQLMSQVLFELHENSWC